MQDNKTFLTMINNVLNTDGFYFCTDYDLTHTQQRLSNTSPDFQEMSLLERVRQTESFEASVTEREREVEHSRVQVFISRYIQKAGQLIVSDCIPHLQ